MDDQQLRNQMVTEQLEARNITDPRVLAALAMARSWLHISPMRTPKVPGTQGPGPNSSAIFYWHTFPHICEISSLSMRTQIVAYVMHTQSLLIICNFSFDYCNDL